MPITKEQRNPERKFGLISTPFSIKFLKFVLLGGFTWFFAFSQMYLYTQVLSISYGLGYAVTQICIIFLNFILARHWIFYSIEENKLRKKRSYDLLSDMQKATFIQNIEEYT